MSFLLQIVYEEFINTLLNMYCLSDYAYYCITWQLHKWVMTLDRTCQCPSRERASERGTSAWPEWRRWGSSINKQFWIDYERLMLPKTCHAVSEDHRVLPWPCGNNFCCDTASRWPGPTKQSWNMLPCLHASILRVPGREDQIVW